MSELNINVEGGSSTKLLTAGKYCPDDIIITASGGGGDIEVEPIVLTGAQSYGCSGDLGNNYINLFGNTISTTELHDTNHMFYQCRTIKEIPFDININTSTYRSMMYMFGNCEMLQELPKINNAYPHSITSIFSNCHRLRNISDDYFNNWNFNRINTYEYAGIIEIFSNCYSLRNIPEYLLKKLWSPTTSNFQLYRVLFSSCYVLDEIKGLGVGTGKLNSNAFNSTFNSCYRVKDITFDVNEDGSPKEAKWKDQIIELDGTMDGVGFTLNWLKNNITNYNSGITADKEVKDDATYQALKNDKDWYATDYPYSRYNHDSAVNTINSLPDTSAYLATAGGTNTIKFLGDAGSATDGGAINTLTDAEIAVAAAKGWTVTLA